MAEKKFKFNFADFLILLVLLAVVAALLYVFVLSDDTVINTEETYTVEAVLRATSINEIFKDTVKEGDVVALAENRNKVIGVVSAPPEVKPSIKTGFDEEAEEEVYTPGESLIDITITVKGEAIKDKWGYRFKDCDDDVIVVNNNYKFLFGETYFNVQCIKVTVLD